MHFRHNFSSFGERMTTNRKTFKHTRTGILALLIITFMTGCDRSNDFAILQKKYEALERRNTRLQESHKAHIKALEELHKIKIEPLQTKLETHEENTLKVFDQLFVDREDYPSFYTSKGVTSDFRIYIIGSTGPAYTVVFEKGGTVMGTDSNRYTWTFTSPRGATVDLDVNNRVIEIRGIVYKSRY